MYGSPPKHTRPAEYRGNERALIAHRIRARKCSAVQCPVAALGRLRRPFHFAYVQQLGNWQGLPDPRTSRLSREVGSSILLAPASQAVKQNLPQVMSYAQNFSLPIPRRSEVRHQLRAIPAELRWQPSEFLNYEAHHPYILLAFPERRLARVSLPVRIAILRIIAAWQDRCSC
jgi:hypothetical protein